MGETHRVEIEIQDHCFLALQAEADRLGVDVVNVVKRATSAWLIDMCESEVPVRSVSPSAGRE
jgi:hypothetical protein